MSRGRGSHPLLAFLEAQDNMRLEQELFGGGYSNGMIFRPRDGLHGVQ